MRPPSSFMLKTPRFARARLACAYFFMSPGMAYGFLTARMPGLKLQASLTEAQIGMVLLLMGIGAVIAMLLGSAVVRRYSSAVCLRAGVVGLTLSMIAVSASTTFPVLAGSIVVVGLCIGLADLALNTHAVHIEREFARPCMAFVHAFYSIGSVAAAVVCGLAAWAQLSVLVNALILFVVYALPLVYYQRHLLPGRPRNAQADTTDASKPVRRTLPPFFVVFCGIMLLMTYVSDGTLAEWGSLLLHETKGASESVAALCYGCFCVTSLAARFYVDRLRLRVSDVTLIVAGSLTAAACMLFILLTPNVWLALGASAFMGLAMAPIGPILFSRAGSHPGIDAEKAIAVVSFFAYGGLLTFPPLVGWLAENFGLTWAMSVSVVTLTLIFLGAPAFKQKKRN